ncbi:hypothetical protein RMATCC62417_08304 [Rhizopus microsporus]|nr:hypothetical protein RMATCC62417_08304 [Rhizopus microsporus]
MPVKAKHAEQVSVDDYLRGGRRSSDTASVVAFKRMLSNSSYFTAGGNHSDQIKPASRIYDLEKPNITLKVPVNVNKVLIADIDNDKKNELILARTDRILHVFRLTSCDTITTTVPADPKGGTQFPTFSNLVSPSSSTSNIYQLNSKSPKKGTRYSLSEVNMWVFDGQISSLCTTTHPEKPDEPLLLVAQPGNTFIIIDKDGNRYNHDFTPQYEQSEQHQQYHSQQDSTEENGAMQDEASDITDGLGNTFTRTNYIIKNWPVVDNNTMAEKGQTGDHSFESGAVATEIVVGKRHLQGNSFTTNEIGMLSMDGKFSIYDLKNKTISHRDLFVTHKLFSLATLDISKPSIRSNNSDYESSVKQSDATASKSGTQTPISHTSQLRYTSELDEGSSSEYDDESWDEVSENEETPGCDLFVACAWNGVTYLIDWSRRREDAKIKYQLVKFAFEGRVCAFTAGLYAIDDENVPCLVYVDFEDQIYVYYDVHISTGPVNGFIDTLDDDVEEAIDRIIGIEGAIDSLIQPEQQKPQRKSNEDEELEEEEGDAIDLGDGWRGIANEEECDFIKQGDSDMLNLADFIHECLYDFDSMKDKLEKEMVSFEKSTLSHRLLPATDIRRLSDLNISIGPNLDNEVTSDRSMIDEEEERASSKYLFSAARSEESSEIYDNDIHIASWIEGSLIASSIFKEPEDSSEEEDQQDY